jgi:sulfur carrier protein
MKITLNNRETVYNSPRLSVRELLATMNFSFPMIVVKVNERLVRKEQYDGVFVQDGDTVEAIHLISGG